METRQRASKEQARTGLQHWAAVLVSCLCMFGWLSSSQATSVIQLSEAQMIEMSSLIVRGKVVSQRYAKGPNGMGVVTLVTVQVLEEVLGRTAPKQVIIRHFGGKIGGRDIRMIGGPRFTTGNEVLVFLQSSKYLPKGEYLLIGLTQGKWIVQRADTKAGSAPSQAPAQSVEPVVVRSLNGVQLFKHNGQPLQAHNHVGDNHAVKSNRQTLAAMTQRLRKSWSAIQLRRKNRVLMLPRPAPKKTKVVLPKTKVKMLKNVKLLNPQVRTPVRTSPPQKRKK